MLQFQFRLDKLLALRAYEERQWELKLAKVAGECLLLRNRIAGHRAKIGSGVERSSAGKSSLDVNQLIAGDLYIYRLYSEIDSFMEQLQKKEEERAAVSKEYLEHSRKRKVLEKLKEKRSAEYYKEQRYEEFKVLDDINNSAETRKNIRG